MADVTMTPVVSSNLASAGYDAETRTLYIEFQSGAEYAYEGVPEEVYRGVLSGGGSYFYRHVRNQYPTQKVS